MRSLAPLGQNPARPRERRWRGPLAAAIAGVSGLLLPALALADEGIGQIKTAMGPVAIQRGGKLEPATVGEHVYRSDVILTRAHASVGITFADNSLLALGPFSTLSLDQFRFNTTTHEGAFDVSLKRGVLAVKSGQIVKQTPEAMRVRTPAALLGVRGTEFVVRADGTTQLMAAAAALRPGVLVAVLGALALGACAHSDLVAVLPESNGHVGAVVVEAGGSKTVLNSAYASARPGGPRGVTTLDAARVDKLFGDTLAAMPRPPVSFTFYFPVGSSEIDPTSAETLKLVFEEVRRRKASEIVITGHTDTVGTDDFNDNLSRQRADAIKQELAPILAEQGVPPEAVSTAGRGKRELADPEPDNTPDPKNRRVELTVR